ncbi:hypothetical protein AAG906_027234 [Vitis piasezkii]
MLTQPPIEGNLDCRARPFHSELCFDIAAFQVRPELAQSFHIEEISHEALADSKRFFLPPGRHGFLPIHDNQPADCIPLLFPRLLCQILEHLGFPSEPQLERKRICREPFTLDKWNNMTAYKIDQPEQPQPVARRASPRHIPESITVAAPAIPRAPPAAPASSQPSTSTEPRMAIPISEYRDSYSFSEHMPRADVGHSGSTSCHLKAAQVHFDRHKSESSTSTPAEPHSHPSESHPPEPQAPTDAPTEEADPSA